MEADAGGLGAHLLASISLPVFYLASSWRHAPRVAVRNTKRNLGRPFAKKKMGSGHNPRPCGPRAHWPMRGGAGARGVRVRAGPESRVGRPGPLGLRQCGMGLDTPGLPRGVGLNTPGLPRGG